jgi:hypothetical protein
LNKHYFLDETGDPGLEDSSNTDYFVIALFSIDDEAMIDKSERKIKAIVNLRRELGLSKDFTFKYSGSRNQSEIKDRFFETIRNLDCQIRTFCVNKNNLFSSFRSMASSNFYQLLIVNLVLYSKEGEIYEDVLVIDDKDKPFKRDLRVQLSRAAKSEKRNRFFKNLILQKYDEKEDGLQCVDMMVGAIMDGIYRRRGRYYEMIKDKIVVLCDESLLK